MFYFSGLLWDRENRLSSCDFFHAFILLLPSFLVALLFICCWKLTLFFHSLLRRKFCQPGSAGISWLAGLPSPPRWEEAEPCFSLQTGLATAFWKGSAASSIQLSMLFLHTAFWAVDAHQAEVFSKLSVTVPISPFPVARTLLDVRVTISAFLCCKATLLLLESQSHWLPHP